MESHLTDIARVIQLAVAPVFLLTALATLITALNNRLGRIVDRRRVILERRPGSDTAAGTDPQGELRLLSRRIRLIYFAILAAVTGALLVCLVVAGAFIGALLAVDIARGVRHPLHPRDVLADRVPRHVPARSVSGRDRRYASHKVAAGLRTGVRPRAPLGGRARPATPRRPRQHNTTMRRIALLAGRPVSWAANCFRCCSTTPTSRKS